MTYLAADSSTLVLLAKCGLLEIVCELFKVVIAPSVAVVELFRLERITFKKARQSLEKLCEIGRYSPEIIAGALALLMEENDGKAHNHKST